MTYDPVVNDVRVETVPLEEMVSEFVGLDDVAVKLTAP
jgi:hypothetical protein